VQALVQAGADVNAGSGNRTTPLMTAALKDSVQAAEALLAAGAVVNVRNAADMTALYWAQSKAMKQLLRQAGADDKAATPYRKRPSRLCSALPGPAIWPGSMRCSKPACRSIASFTMDARH
jgi:hypothetical protein